MIENTYFQKNGISLYHEDCMKIMSKIPDETIDIVTTDPPYGIDYLSDRTHKVFSKIKGDTSIKTDWIKEVYRILKQDSAFYVFTRFDVYPEWLKAIQEYFTVRNCIVWTKNYHTGGDLTGNFGSAHEFIIYATKGYPLLHGNRPTNIWKTYQKIANKMVHPTQKPVELFTKMIRVSCDTDGILLDPFVGSGTALVACIQMGIQGIGIEIDERYCKAAVERIKTAGKDNQMRILPKSELRKLIQ